MVSLCFLGVKVLTTNATRPMHLKKNQHQVLGGAARSSHTRTWKWNSCFLMLLN